MFPTYRSQEIERKGVILQPLEVLNDYDFNRPHRHDYFELFFFEKGGGTHLIDFTEFPIVDRSIHLVAPGQVHHVKRALNSFGFVAFFELQALAANPMLERFFFQFTYLGSLELSPCFTLVERPWSVDYFSLLKAIHESQGKYDSNHLQLRLIHTINSIGIDCLSLSKEEQLEGPSLYREFRVLVKEKFKSLKKVQDYASLLCVSDRQLSETVKTASGKSPSEIIHFQVILEAKRLLNLGISVKEVSYALGFEDPSHFSKFFKGKLGQSPSDFQKYT